MIQLHEVKQVSHAVSQKWLSNTKHSHQQGNYKNVCQWCRVGFEGCVEMEVLHLRKFPQSQNLTKRGATANCRFITVTLLCINWKKTGTHIQKNVFQETNQWELPAVSRVSQEVHLKMLPGATEQFLFSEGQDGLVNDFHWLPDLVLLDHKWRG